MTQRRWQQVLDDAGRFLDRWGNQAHELGWNAADLFGVHPQALDARCCPWNVSRDSRSGWFPKHEKSAFRRKIARCWKLVADRR